MMANPSKKTVSWWTRGFLLENCNCQLICPGHIHFTQLCTFDRCVGYWAIRFDEGQFGQVSLAGTAAVIIFDSPKKMIEGNWYELIIIGANASKSQRRAIEAILTGRVGGPWEVLARFVGERGLTRYLPIRINDGQPRIRVEINGIFESEIIRIRGKDRLLPVTIENMFNQIHSPLQVVAQGTTRYDDGQIIIQNKGTHGLYSKFSWSEKKS
jgi:hypothetical protein